MSWKTAVTVFSLRYSFIPVFCCIQCYYTAAQDSRSQYPAVLSNSFIGVNAGYIDYAFSLKQLEPGYTAESVEVPHAAIRIILFGHEFNKYLSAQISYMRPVKWVRYNNINGIKGTQTVWMNIAGLTLRSQVPLSKKIAWYGEAGLVIVTRNGFEVNAVPVVKNANYATMLWGAGLQYRLDNNRDLMISAVSSPAHGRAKQPATIFYSAGFHYTMRPLSKAKWENNARSGYRFTQNLLQVGYTTNAAGYEVNNFVSRKIPVFWGGFVHVEKGFSLHYRRNLFHGRKIFSLDWGADISYWRTRKNKDDFFTASVFPVFRFNVLRTTNTDLYLHYALAGPAFISKSKLDDVDTGTWFTFHDFMGVGVFAGKKKNLNAEFRIAHYSNGNIFPQNEGIKVPLSLNLGYAFD